MDSHRARRGETAWRFRPIGMLGPCVRTTPKVFAPLAFSALSVLLSTGVCLADDGTNADPCAMPIAAVLADRPGTGRTTSSGGSPCVVSPNDVVVESGFRRQVTMDPGTTTLASGPLTFLRAGLVPRLELGIALPSNESRAIEGPSAVDAARGNTDLVVAAKYQLSDSAGTQSSLGLSYSPPTGTGEFTAGAPTFSVGANFGATLTSKLSLAVSNTFGTAVGADVHGASETFFVFAPSFTVGYALDGKTTILVQDALVSRQGPTLRSGSRGFVAVQRAVGGRFALDADYEMNFAPVLGSRATAVGLGFVWVASSRK